MSSVECLREFVSERLTTATEEIFRVFKQTIVEYEEEIDRQRRLLDIIWNPDIKLHRIEFPQQNIPQEEVLADQPLCNHEKNSSLDQEEPEPPQIKEEHEEHCTSREGGAQPELKQETDAFMVTPSEDQTLNLCISETWSAVKEKPLNCISVKSSVVSEPNNDHQLHSHNSHVADSNFTVTPAHDESDSSEPEAICDHQSLSNNSRVPESRGRKGGKHGNARSTRNAEPKPKNRRYKIRGHGTMSKIDGYAHTDHQPLANNSRVPKCRDQKRGKHGDSRSTRNAASKPNKRHHKSKSRSNNVYNPTLSKIDCNSHTDHQPLSNNSRVLKSRDQKQGKHGDSRSTRDADSKPNKRLCKSKSHINNEYNPTMSKKDCNTHTGTSSLKCDICEKDFKHKSSLQTHLRRHTSERPYSCNVCGKCFICISELSVHMRNHTGEKPYLCKACGRAFRWSSAFSVHMRIHTGEKPFTCKTCGKGFRTSGDLAAHSRIHTGEKPLKCTTCGKDFRSNSALLVHTRIHTGEKPLKCKTWDRFQK